MEILIVVLVGIVLAGVWRYAAVSLDLRSAKKSTADGVPESADLSKELKELIELNKEKSRSWTGFLQNLGFFLAGAFVSLYASEIRTFLAAAF